MCFKRNVAALVVTNLKTECNGAIRLSYMTSNSVSTSRFPRLFAQSSILSTFQCYLRDIFLPFRRLCYRVLTLPWEGVPMITPRFLLYFGAVCLLFVKPLPAQNVSNPPSNPALVRSLTIESFQQRVQALGFTTTRGNADGKQDPYFTFMAEGRKVGGLLENPAVLELFVSYKDGAIADSKAQLFNAAYTANASDQFRA